MPPCAMLPITTLRKLANDHFPEDNVEKILNLPVGKQKACFDKLKKQLDKLPNMDVWVRESEKNSKHFYMAVYVRGPSSGRNPNDYFKLFFKTVGGVAGLWMYDAKRRRKTATKLDPIPIANLDQIFEFIQIVRQRQNRDHLRDEKKLKVAGLQQTGLTARLKELGKQHNFAFAIGGTKRDVHLSIRLQGRKTGYHFAFPKSRLDRVLLEVPDLIVTLENLQTLGVSFRTRKRKRHHAPQIDWIEPPKSAQPASAKKR